MDLLEERYIKHVNIRVLKKYIEQKKKQIIQEQEELKMLEEELVKEQESSLPILLFAIDETLPISNDERNWNYEYIYYCPDLDDIKYVTDEKLLPNAIDLRESFIDMGIPKNASPGSAWNYGNEIKEVVSIVKKEINYFILVNKDSSWNELGAYLVDKFNEKDYVKKLYKNQIIKKDLGED